MREIKFRSLYEGVWYYQTLDEILTITLAAFRNGNHKTQFTGLHDKNNNPIYEGDIVKCGYGTGEVVYMLGSFLVRWIDDKEATMEFVGFNNKCRRQREDDEQFEIIGNIYESPLIK